MKLPVLVACLAASAPLAWAAGPADPAEPVPRPSYRSVFEDLPSGVEEELLPWKQANAAVAEFPRGHADLLKWEEAQGQVGPAARPAAPAAPPQAAQPRTPPAPAAGHHAH